MGLESIPAEWSVARRIGFRFVFVYFVLYILPFPFNAVPFFSSTVSQWAMWLVQQYEVPWEKLIDWTAANVFHVSAAIRPNGSGDTTYNYIQIFCIAVIAAAVTTLWSLLGWKWKNHERLFRGLRVYVRYYVATTMIVYGAIKVIKSQFPDPSLDRLMQNFGDASPMGLLWTFMGASEGYNIFAGAGELLGGLLLTTRRTTLLGALVTIGVMGHVAALNFFYDVPVKLMSSHLLLMAAWLTVPDMKRLVRFFVLNRSTEPADIPPIAHRPILYWTVVSLRTLAVIVFVLLNIEQAMQGRDYWATQINSWPVTGIWAVEELELDGKSGPALPDSEAWQRVVFDQGWLVAIHFKSGPRARYSANLSVPEQTITQNTGNNKSVQGWKWTWSRVGPGEVKLEGTFKGRAMKAKLKREPEQNFLLMNRGFHWISEYPFNR